MELDYHTLGILTQEEILFHLHDFLEYAHSSGESEVRIITGKGSVVRPLVMSELKRVPYVHTFRRAGYFEGQDGVVVVTFA